MSELEASAWGALHAGDVVLGADGETWGVVVIRWDGSRISIALHRHGRNVEGYPNPSDPVYVVHRADNEAEAKAWSVLSAANFEPEVINETWEVGS